MRVSYKDVSYRLTGISCPLFGISWSPTESERKIAKDLIADLEDHRSLYNPYQLEVVGAVIRSVERLRRVLTETLKRTESGSEEFVDSVRAMRRASRQFLDETGDLHRSGSDFFHHLGMGEQMRIGSALGELRYAFGVHIGKISVMYGIDIEEELAQLLPAPDDSGSDI